MDRGILLAAQAVLTKGPMGQGIDSTEVDDKENGEDASNEMGKEDPMVLVDFGNRKQAIVIKGRNDKEAHDKGENGKIVHYQASPCHLLPRQKQEETKMANKRPK
jgi:hypothetical protein